MTIRLCLGCRRQILAPFSRCGSCGATKSDSAERKAKKAERYGAEYRRARARWAEVIAAYGFRCWRCKRLWPAGVDRKVWHCDHRPAPYNDFHPACAKCNTSASRGGLGEAPLRQAPAPRWQP